MSSAMSAQSSFSRRESRNREAAGWPLHFIRSGFVSVGANPEIVRRKTLGNTDFHAIGFSRRESRNREAELAIARIQREHLVSVGANPEIVRRFVGESVRR